ncbi:MAG: hypothetical protein AAGA95_10585 [Pseudomonadota bacterium]
MSEKLEQQITRIAIALVGVFIALKQAGVLPSDRKDTSTMERHFNSVIGLIVLGVMAWVGATTQNLTTEVAELSVRYEEMDARFDTLEEGTKDRFTGNDSILLRETIIERIEASERQLMGRMSDQETEINRMWDRVNALEDQR